MSKRIGIGDNYALAFGFSWQPIDPLESSGSQRKQLIAQGMLWEASFKTTRNQVEFIGASREDFAPIKNVTTVAGAAQMAKHPRLAGRTVFIVMEDVVEGAHYNEVAVVGLINGNIVVDDYTTTQFLGKLRAEYRDKVANTNRQFEVVGKSVTLGALAESFSWNDFKPTKSGFFGKDTDLPAIHVKSLEPKIAPAIVWGAVISLALMGAAWGYTDYTAAQEARKAAARLKEQQNSGPIRYSKSIVNLLAEPVMPANSTFAILREALQGLEVERSGWHLSRVNCSQDGSCSATWGNYLNLANYRDFVAGAPKEWGTIALNIKGDELSHKLPTKLPMRKLPAQTTWPDLRTFLMSGFSEWQKYWVLSFHPDLPAEPIVMGVPSGVDAKAAIEFPDAVLATKWTIKHTPWYLSELFDKSIEHPAANAPDSMTVENITINIEKDQSVLFDAEGKIYVRK